MQDLRIPGPKYNFVCYRCGCIIGTGEKMVSLSISVETPTEDGGLEGSEATTISTLCLGCASVLLGQAIVREPGLMMPFPGKDLPEPEDEEDVPPMNDVADEGDVVAGGTQNDLDFADLYLAIGLRSMEQEDWDRAITAFTSLIELEPHSAFAYDRRGIAYGRVERYHEAIADFDEAIRIDPSFAGAYNNRGLSYYKQYRFGEAIADYDVAIWLAPGVGTFYANRGLAHSAKGDLYVAIADYDKAIELDPGLQETHNNRGEAYADLGQYEKALVDFEYELTINPNDIVAYANRVWAAAVLLDHGKLGQNHFDKGGA